jgi:hypothetical protein
MVTAELQIDKAAYLQRKIQLSGNSNYPENPIIWMVRRPKYSG